MKAIQWAHAFAQRKRQRNSDTATLSGVPPDPDRRRFSLSIEKSVAGRSAAALPPLELSDQSTLHSTSVVRVFDTQLAAFEYFDRLLLAASSAGRLSDVIGSEAGVKILANENGPGGRRCFLVAHTSALWTKLCALPPIRRHFYEIIRDGAPCHLYFDLEFHRPLTPQQLQNNSSESSCADVGSRRANGSVDGERLTAILLHRTAVALQNSFGIRIQSSDVLQLESSTPDKFSRHVVIRLPSTATAFDSINKSTSSSSGSDDSGCYLDLPGVPLTSPAIPMFRDVSHVGAFVHALVSDLERERASDADVRCLWVPSVKGRAGGAVGGTRSVTLNNSTDAGTATANDYAAVSGHRTSTANVAPAATPAEFIADLSVYTRNRTMRLPYSCKYGKTAVLLPASNNHLLATEGSSTRPASPSATSSLLASSTRPASLSSSSSLLALSARPASPSSSALASSSSCGPSDSSLSPLEQRYWVERNKVVCGHVLQVEVVAKRGAEEEEYLHERLVSRLRSNSISSNNNSGSIGTQISSGGGGKSTQSSSSNISSSQSSNGNGSAHISSISNCDAANFNSSGFALNSHSTNSTSFSFNKSSNNCGSDSSASVAPLPQQQTYQVQFGSAEWERRIWLASFITDHLPPVALMQQIGAKLQLRPQHTGASAPLSHQQLQLEEGHHQRQGKKDAIPQQPRAAAAAGSASTSPNVRKSGGILPRLFLLHTHSNDTGADVSSSRVSSASLSSSFSAPLLHPALHPLDTKLNLGSGDGGIVQNSKLNLGTGGCGSSGTTSKLSCCSGGGGIVPLRTYSTSKGPGPPPFPSLAAWVCMISSTSHPWSAAAAGAVPASAASPSVFIGSTSTLVSSASAPVRRATSESAHIRGWSSTTNVYAAVHISTLTRPLSHQTIATSLRSNTESSRSSSSSSSLLLPSISTPPACSSELQLGTAANASELQLGATSEISLISSVQYEIGGARFCHRIGREHVSNHIAWRCDLQTRRAVQLCWDTDCRSAAGGRGAVSLDIPLTVLPEQLPAGMTLRSS